MESEIAVPAGFELTCPQCQQVVETVKIVEVDEPIMITEKLIFLTGDRPEMTGFPCRHIINGATLRRLDGRPLTDPMPEKT